MTVNWLDVLVALVFIGFFTTCFLKFPGMRLHWSIGALIILSFLIPLPFFSMGIEYDQLPRSAKEGLHDNFEFLFLLFKFPMYWCTLGCLWATYSILRNRARNRSTANRSTSNSNN